MPIDWRHYSATSTAIIRTKYYKRPTSINGHLSSIANTQTCRGISYAFNTEVKNLIDMAMITPSPTCACNMDYEI